MTGDKRSAGIRVKNAENVEVSNNRSEGFDDGISIEDSHRVRGHGNYSTRANETASARWYQKPLWQIVIGLIVTVGGALIVWLLGID